MERRINKIEKRKKGIIMKKDVEPNRILKSQGIKLPDRKVEPVLTLEPEIKRTNLKDKKLKYLILVFLILLLVLGIGYGGYRLIKFSIFNFQFSKQLSNDQLKKEQNTEEIIEELGKLVELPKNDVPTVLTVTDLKPLRNQPFFAEAEIGDKVLIFSQSKRAVLYRPSEKKVVSIAPLK